MGVDEHPQKSRRPDVAGGVGEQGLGVMPAERLHHCPVSALQEQIELRLQLARGRERGAKLGFPGREEDGGELVTRRARGGGRPFGAAEVLQHLQQGPGPAWAQQPRPQAGRLERLQS